MDLDSVAGRSTTISRRRGSVLILAAIAAALSLAPGVPAQATPNTAKAWGLNSHGALGNGASTGPEECGPFKEPCSATPIAVKNLSGVTAVSGGSSLSEHSLALLEGGTVMAWGANDSGQLGNGTTTDSPVPVAVSGLLIEATTIAAGWGHSLALLSNGKVMAWGKNGSGQLGNGTTVNSDVPVEVTGLAGEAKAIAAGNEFSLALLKSGKVMAWGANTEGQLGNGTTVKSTGPVEVTGLSEEVKAIAAGKLYSLAILKGGTVVAWGKDNNGELGNGAEKNSATPVAVSGLTKVGAVAAGGNHSMAMLEGNGKVMAWGENSVGELGDGSSTGPELCGVTTPCAKTPVEVSGLSGARAIAAGEEHSLVLLADGATMAWGSNLRGQLGGGTSTGPEVCGIEATSCSTKPVGVSKVAGAKGIGAGSAHSLAFGPPPTVTAVKPKKGPVGGGTTVIIAGTDLTGATAVKFGSTSASSFTVNSPTSISAVSPAEPAGKVDVTVTTSWGMSPISAADRFTFTPTVTGLSPNSGPAAGGTSLTVTGTGFALGTTATKFKFGLTKASSVNCTSTTTCTVVAPAHEVGTVDVKATVNSVSSPKNPSGDHFTYS
jgi:alpha-tubulin suppressor-like RCC1 family protein